MAEESGVGVRRRGRQEIARLAALYRKSGMGRSEFCRSHGMALSTLARHLKKQSGEQRLSGNSMAGESRLIAVELAAMSASAATGKQHSALTVLLSNGRKVEVGSGFDAETLAELVSVLERL
jgi:predicted ArsR family transcriptional regulator